MCGLYIMRSPAVGLTGFYRVSANGGSPEKSGFLSPLTVKTFKS